jgi:hypothetical protein
MCALALFIIPHMRGFALSGPLFRERMRLTSGVQMRVFRDAKARIAHTVGEDAVETHEYEGLGHVTSGAEIRDMCNFLEMLIPE